MSKETSIRFSPEAWRSLVTEASRDDDLETGGILIGSAIENGDERLVEIHRNCTRHAARHHSRYSPDVPYDNDSISYYRSNVGWTYLGEWHRHPGALTTLSSVDIAMARSLLAEEKHGFLLLPIATWEKGQIRLDIHIATDEGIEHVRTLYALPEDIRKERNLMEPKVYVDSSWIENFISSPASAATYKGHRNADGHFIFMNIPGNGQATLDLVRSGEETPLVDRADRVTCICPEEGLLRFFCVREGEALELNGQAVDPEEDLYSRNRGLLETTELRDKTVFIAGCGSLGSAMALELARAGVGSLHLADPDSLEPHTIARHQCDLTDLGRPKAEAVRDRIAAIAPAALVQTHVMDISADGDAMERTEEIARECDLLVCTTDTDDSRAFVNDLTLRCAIPSLQVGLHSRAQSGIIQIVRPDGGACFLCHRDKTLDQNHLRDTTIAYSDAQSLRDLTVQPGLSAQIGLIAEGAVIRAIDFLCSRSDGGTLPPLTLVYACHAEEGTMGRPYLRFVHMEVEANTDCPACGAK